MKFGLTNSQYQYLSEKLVEPLKKVGLEVYCFGSRARGDHQLFSDLDLMLVGEVTVQRQQLKGQLEEMLSKSNFPLKVDLVFFDEFSPSYQVSYLEDRKLW